jgi:predicted GH43/DUF377 family glycosyl hydrolase
MTKFQWEKQGLIYVPSGDGIFKTHATRPIPHRIDDKVLRLYFSSRDEDDRPLPTYIDVDSRDPNSVLHVNEKPLMPLGRIGAFDDSGITPTCVLEQDGELLLYYVGWKRRRVNVTIEASIGLAKFNRSKDSLERVFEGPILAQDKNHPFLVAAPFVVHDDGKYKMWYCSATEWRLCDTGPEMIYRVRYAESENGVDWIPEKEPAIDYAYDGEIISAPWVIKHGSKYHMWYSTRGSETRDAKRFAMGYAESRDGVKWTRMDERVGITTSPSGWDSEMACYPSFFQADGTTYMFYSGNGVGKGGIGCATTDRFLV